MKGVVDRIEGNFAVVCLDDGEVIDIPLNEFEGDLHEGDVVFKREKWQIDKEETKIRKHEVEKYLDLFNE